MFKVYISDSVYKDIVNAEEQKVASGRSFLYKLLKQQPVQQLSEIETRVTQPIENNGLLSKTILWGSSISI
jgi:hypothetical protein